VYTYAGRKITGRQDPRPFGDLRAGLDGDFADHAAALTWVRDDVEKEDEVQRVEFLGPEGDWRWAGPLVG